MTDKAQGRARVRVVARAVMSNHGWNIQDVINRSADIDDEGPLDRKTIQTFLEGTRWPQQRTLGRIEKALGCPPGEFARVFEDQDWTVSDVGGLTEDADYVAAPGERVEPGTHDDQVLTELRAMREDINALSRRVARIESNPEPVGGADGAV